MHVKERWVIYGEDNKILFYDYLLWLPLPLFMLHPTFHERRKVLTPNLSFLVFKPVKLTGQNWL